MRGGLPFLWMQDEADSQVALVFSVGLVDGLHARSGVTHLVEYLPLEMSLDQTDEVVRDLAAVGAGLACLPMDRLARDQGVREPRGR